MWTPDQDPIPGNAEIEYFWLRGECAPGHARDANDGRSSPYLQTFHDLLSRLWLHATPLPREVTGPVVNPQNTEAMVGSQLG
jgi:hypothetical protein